MIVYVSPVDKACLVPETNFTLGSYETFQPVCKDEKRPKTMGMSSGAKFEKQNKHVETQKIITWQLLKLYQCRQMGCL